MFKLILAGLWRYKARVVFISLSTIVGVTFATAALVLRDSVTEGVTRLEESVNLEVYGDVWLQERPSYILDVEGEAADGAAAPSPNKPAVISSLDDDLIAGIKQLDYSFKEVSGFIEGEASSGFSLRDTTGEDVTTESEFLLVFSYNEDSELNFLKIEEGRSPQTSSEVAIDRLTAKRRGLTIGDTITWQQNTPEDILDTSRQPPIHSLTIVGFSGFRSALLNLSQDLTQLPLIILHPPLARQVISNLPPQDQWTDIRVKLDGNTVDADHRKLKAAISELTDSRIAITTVAEETTKQNLEDLGKDAKTVINAISYSILAFVILAMFVGVFVVINTYNVLLAQRAKETALLRALSLTRGQVVKMVFWESTCIGLFAAVVGILLGIGVATVVFNVIPQVDYIFEDTFITVSATSFIFPIILALVVSAVAGIFPAIKASRQSPIEVLADAQVLKPQSILARAIVGGSILALAALGIVLALILVFNSDGGSTATSSGAVLLLGAFAVLVSNFLVFIGLVIFSPILLRAFARFFTFLTSRLKMFSGQLAAGNVLRAPKQAAFAANALIIGISLIVLATTLIHSFRVTTVALVEKYIPAEWTITIDYGKVDDFVDPAEDSPETPRTISDLNLINSEVVERLHSSPYIRHLTTFRYLPLREHITHTPLVSINTAQYLREVGSSEIPIEAIESLQRGEVIYVGFEPQGLTWGDKAEIRFYEGSEDGVRARGSSNEEEKAAASFVLGASVQTESLSLLSNFLVEDRYLKAQAPHLVDGNYNVLWFDGQEGVEQEVIETSLETLLDDFPYLTYAGRSGIVGYIEDGFNFLLNIFRGLLSLSVIVAFIGVFNVLSLSVIERIREIGILRAVGLTKSQTAHMIFLESLLVVFFGTLLGVVLGIFFAWISWLLITSNQLAGQAEELDLIFKIPWLQMLLYGGITAATAIIAALWPTIRAVRLRIIAAIRHL